MTHYLINILDLSDVKCGGAESLRVMSFITKIFDIVFILVPIFLIVLISIDFFKNVIAQKEDDMSKNLNLAIKRIIMCVGLFLVPTIIYAVMNLLGDAGVEYAECIEIARTEDDFSQYEIDFPDNNPQKSNNSNENKEDDSDLVDMVPTKDR